MNHSCDHPSGHTGDGWRDERRGIPGTG